MARGHGCRLIGRRAGRGADLCAARANVPTRPLQTIERAHSPKNLWQKIRLKRQYAQVCLPGARAGGRRLLRRCRTLRHPQTDPALAPAPVARRHLLPQPLSCARAAAPPLPPAAHTHARL